VRPSRFEAADFTELRAAAPTKPQKETAINPGRGLMAVVEAAAQRCVLAQRDSVVMDVAQN
jgi:hypothetical protein